MIALLRPELSLSAPESMASVTKRDEPLRVIASLFAWAWMVRIRAPDVLIL